MAGGDTVEGAMAMTGPDGEPTRKAWQTLARKLATRPGFLASWWAPAEWPALWARLGLGELAGYRLLVCRPPRPDRWDEDITVVADANNVLPIQLEVELLVVQAQTLLAVRSRPRRP
jgi:hypothetical protein